MTIYLGLVQLVSLCIRVTFVATFLLTSLTLILLLPITHRTSFNPSAVNTSTHATWQTDKSSSSTIPGAVANIKKCFGYKRKWNFRSTTGFTALGVIKAGDAGSEDDDADDINGVLFQVPRDEMPNFDRREVGYTRVDVPLQFLEFHPHMTGSTPQTQFSLDSNDKIWLYVPQPSQTMYADENHPLLQSYVDTGKSKYPMLLVSTFY